MWNKIVSNSSHKNSHNSNSNLQTGQILAIPIPGNIEVTNMQAGEISQLLNREPEAIKIEDFIDQFFRFRGLSSSDSENSDNAMSGFIAVPGSSLNIEQFHYLIRALLEKTGIGNRMLNEPQIGARFREFLAPIYTTGGGSSVSEEFFRESLALNPRSLQLLISFGEMLEERNRLSESRESFERAAKSPELDTRNYPITTNENLQDVIIRRTQNLVERENRGLIHPSREIIPNTSEARLNRSIVAIHLGNETNEKLAGTGVVVKRSGNAVYVVTARHVLFDDNNHLNNEDVRVEFYSEYQKNRQRLRLYVEIVPQSLNHTDLDLVILKVIGGVPKDVEPLKLSSDLLKKGEILRVIGHPASSTERWLPTPAILEGGVKYGSFSGIQMTLPQRSELQDAQGYSGGAVVNSKNELVGIIYATESGSSLASAYSPETIKRILEE